MNTNQSKKNILFACLSLLVVTMACLSSSTEIDNEIDEKREAELEATIVSLEETQAAFEIEAFPSATPTLFPSATPTETIQPVDVSTEEVIQDEPLELSSGDIFYNTNFDESQLEGWTYFFCDYDDWISRLEDRDYSIYTDSGYLYVELNKNPVCTHLMYEDLYLDRDNADVRVDVFFNNLGVRDNYIGVTCRASERGWYELGMSSDGFWFIGKYDAEALYYHTLAEGGIPGYDWKISEHQITATCIGDEITLYIDGSQPDKASVNDRTFREGIVGIDVGSYEVPRVKVELDWFTISVP